MAAEAAPGSRPPSSGTQGTIPARKRPGRPPAFSGCQVCGADCSVQGRSFHQRYHICHVHMAAESVERDGVPHRFCQQCGRFHTLDRFSPRMHSCREQLARHAERRRRVRALASLAANAAGGRGRRQPAPAPQPTADPSLGTNASAVVEVAGAGQLLPTLAVPRATFDHGAMECLDKIEPASHAGVKVHLSPHAPHERSSGSSASTHSMHQAGQASPASSCGGMEALLAAAKEEEEEEEQRQRQAKRRRSSTAPQQEQEASMEPDPSWFAAPALTAAAPPHMSQLAYASSAPPAMGVLQGSHALPLLWVGQADHASPMLPQLPAAAAGPFLAFHDHQRRPSPPYLQQQAGDVSAALPTAHEISLLLQHLMPSPVPGGLRLGAALPPTVLAQAGAALQFAAAQQQAQHAQREGQLQQLLLARERQQQEQQVSCLFQAAVGRLLSSILAVHGSQPLP